MLRIKSVYDNDCLYYEIRRICNYDNISILCTVSKKLTAQYSLLQSDYIWRFVSLSSEVVGTQGKLKHRCPTLGLIERDSHTQTVHVRKGRNQNKRWTCVVFFFLFALPRLCSWRIFFLFYFVSLVQPFWLISLLLAIF